MNDSLARKLSALLAKTIENGCTEGEATAAAAKAQELMDAHGLTHADVSAAGDRAAETLIDASSVETFGRSYLHPATFTMKAIADYTGCRTWVRRPGRGHQGPKRPGAVLTFFGTRTDTQIAHYLYTTFERAMDTEWKRQGKSLSGNVHGRTARRDFMLGMAERLSERLWELIRERDARTAKTTGTSSALTVVEKDALVRKALEKTHMKFRQERRASADNRYGSAFQAGREAGNRVGIAAGGLAGNAGGLLR